MGFLNKITAAIIGGIQGTFIGASLSWRLDSRYFLFNASMRNYIRVIFKMAIRDSFPILPFLLIYLAIISLFTFSVTILQSAAFTLFGLVTGAYMGFKGGLISSGDMKAPVWSLFHIFKTYIVVNLEGHDRGQMCHYRARNFKGFSRPITGNHDNLLICDLLYKMPYDQALKQFFTFPPESPIAKAWKLEFVQLKDLSFLTSIGESLISPNFQQKSSAESLLRLLFRNQLLVVDDFPIDNKEPIITCFNKERTAQINMLLLLPSTGLRRRRDTLLPSTLRQQRMDTPLENFYIHPLYDKNIMNLVLGGSVSHHSKQSIEISPPGELKDTDEIRQRRSSKSSKDESEELTDSTPLLN